MKRKLEMNIGIERAKQKIQERKERLRMMYA